MCVCVCVCVYYSWHKGTRERLTSSVVVNVSLGKHSVVLNLGLAERGAVIADDDELRLAGSQGLQGRLIAQGVLARLHHQRKARVDGLGRCLNFLGHFDYLIVLLSCTRERKQAAADKSRYTWRHRQRMVAYIHRKVSTRQKIN